MTFEKASDKTYTLKSGLPPGGAMTDTGDNDTSVIRGPAIKKAGRWDSYETGKAARCLMISLQFGRRGQIELPNKNKTAAG